MKASPRPLIAAALLLALTRSAVASAQEVPPPPPAPIAGPHLALDVGLHLNAAVIQQGDGAGRDSTTAVGGGIGGHVGIGIDHVALLLLVHAGFGVAASQPAREYAGVGPALLFALRPLDEAGTRVSIELGGGVDYGVSVTGSAVDESVEGAFVTSHFRLLVTLGENDTPFTLGTHVIVAVPPDAPDLFGVSGGAVISVRSL